jgi:hypothetical protein
MTVSLPYKHGHDWVVAVKRCASCARDHDNAAIVLKEGSVWYRCPTSSNLIYIREQKGGS